MIMISTRQKCNPKSKMVGLRSYIFKKNYRTYQMRKYWTTEAFIYEVFWINHTFFFQHLQSFQSCVLSGLMECSAIQILHLYNEENMNRERVVNFKILRLI